MVKGGHRLTGSKIWITNAPIADVAIIWAKTEDDIIRGFILERGWPGLSFPKIEGKMSLRASSTCEIVMDDVFVPDANLLPGAQGLARPRSEVRLVGKECVSTCHYRRSPYHSKNTSIHKISKYN